MFLTDLPDIHSPRFLQVIRVKSGSGISAMVCGSPVRAAIHYYRGKSYPCVSSTDIQCCLCGKGLTKRLYAWWPIRGQNGKGAVLEVTQTVDSQISEAVKICTPDQVAIATVSRAAGRKNAPLTCDVSYRKLLNKERQHRVRVEIDQDLMKRTLCRLWDLPEWDPGMNENEFDQITARYIREMVAAEVLR